MHKKHKDKMLLERHKDISRIDQASKRAHGWYVRIRYKGKTFSKLFSDRKCGGKYSGLLAAISWRDTKEKEIGKTRTDKHIVTSSSSNSGVVGVRLNEKLNRYEVSWVTAEGKQGKTSISIKSHGKEKAFQKACQIRKAKEAERIMGT